MAFGDADASTPAFVKASVGTKDVTTASFTPPAGALLVAFAFHDTAGGNVTSSSVVTDSAGLTWTIRCTVSKASDGTGFNDGHLQVSTAVVASSAAMTVTTTGTNCNNPAGLYVRVITGADTATPMDATPAENTSDNAAISQAITTATDGARVFLIATDWNVAANPTAGANQTAVVSDGIGAPDMRVYVGVQNAVTSPAGSVTMSTATPTTGNHNNFAAVAIRPAAGGATNLNVGNAASAVAAGAVALSSGLAAGNAASSVAANAAALSASISAGNAASSVAAGAATLSASLAVGSAALSIGAFNATVTSGSNLAVGNVASSVAANAVALSASPAAGLGATAVAANAVGLSSGLAATFGAVTIGAFDATVTGGATAINAGAISVSVGAFDVTLTGGTVVTVPGSWYGLLDVLNEVRATLAEERARPPEACWHDGEPLRQHRGIYHCIFCGRHYAGDGSTV